MAKIVATRTTDCDSRSTASSSAERAVAEVAAAGSEKERRDARHRHINLLKEVIKDVEGKFKMGVASRVDVIAIEAALLKAESQLKRDDDLSTFPGDKQPMADHTVTAPDHSETQLQEAIATFNADVAKHFGDAERWQTTLRSEQFPDPLTEDEVIEAIRGWVPDDSPGAKAAESVFKGIVETSVLPARSRLRYRLQWELPDGERDVPDYEHECRMWNIQLDVFTGSTTGYGLRIRREIVDRRVALRPNPGYAWVVDPYTLTAPLPASWNAGGVICACENRNDGSLKITASWMLDKLRGDELLQDVRLVAFDSEANRYLLSKRGLGHNTSGDAVLVAQQFLLDIETLAASKVKYLGIEALTRNGQ